MSNDNFSFLSKVDRLALIGQGNTAEIYDYDNDCILKLFRDGFPKTGVSKEWICFLF